LNYVDYKDFSIPLLWTAAVRPLLGSARKQRNWQRLSTQRATALLHSDLVVRL